MADQSRLLSPYNTPRKPDPKDKQKTPTRAISPLVVNGKGRPRPRGHKETEHQKLSLPSSRLLQARVQKSVVPSSFKPLQTGTT
jgi:hypothetical protein